jgi:DNA-binding beta-propeller fold protein YncE
MDDKENLKDATDLVATNDSIYVTDTGNNRVAVYSITDNLSFKFAFGSKGNKDGEFNEPIGLAVSDNNVYVSDSQNRRISVHRLDPNGTFVNTFTHNKKDVPSYLPIMAFANNKIYIAYFGNVMVFSEDLHEHAS